MTPRVLACIGLGANLGDATATVQAALQALDALPHTRLLKASRLYRTPAWGKTDQPAFVNAAAVLETELDARALLDAMLGIERDHGRERLDGQRWGARTLDLDLLLYGDRSSTNPASTCRIRTCTSAHSRWCRWWKSRRTWSFPATAAPPTWWPRWSPATSTR